MSLRVKRRTGILPVIPTDRLEACPTERPGDPAIIEVTESHLPSKNPPNPPLTKGGNALTSPFYKGGTGGILMLGIVFAFTQVNSFNLNSRER